MEGFEGRHMPTADLPCLPFACLALTSIRGTDAADTVVTYLFLCK